MRKILLFVALVILVPVLATAINPQEPGPAKFVQGGEVEIVTFGPYTSTTTGPSAYSIWSSDAQPLWVRLFLPRPFSYGDFETTAWKVPQGYMEACPVAVDTMGGFYTFLEVNATSVASTDSVIVKPYFGGVGK